MNLREHVVEIEKKYQAGQEIFRRKSVGFLLERISQLEQSAQHRMKSDAGELSVEDFLTESFGADSLDEIFGE